MAQTYSPTSFFFVAPAALSSAADSNYVADAFGPIVTIDGSTQQKTSKKYRTTTVVRSSNQTLNKVFAVCAGTLLIQPSQDTIQGHPPKLNIILKPFATYGVLKIKYFIYRGVNKSDLITNNALTVVNTQDQNQPELIQNLWAGYSRFYPGEAKPTNFALSKIGYDPANQLLATSLDTVFNYKGNTYKLPECKEGEHIANFSSQLGLDIVIDYGDYELEKQEILFKLNLDYAQKLVHELDITPYQADDIKLRRYKEHIHQFIDPAAFWGSHIDCGKIKISGNLSFNTADEVFENILKRFQNSNKIYFYLQAEKGRTYNFYDNNRTVAINLDSVSGSLSWDFNNTNEWPILIKDFTITDNSKSILQCIVDFDMADSHLDQSDMRASVDAFFPGNRIDILTKEYKYNTISAGPGHLPALKFEFKQHNNPSNKQSCATFVFIYCNSKQVDPTVTVGPANQIIQSNVYYNQLWPVNFTATFNIPSGNDVSYWTTYDKSRMVNLAPICNLGASIQNKLFFDYGTDIANQPVARRLFLGIIKRNTSPKAGYNKLNVTDITPSLTVKASSYAAYIDNVYAKDSDFDLYRGQTIDGGINIHTLALVNESDIELKSSFFHLGITNAQYNVLINLIPVTGADNVFFYLDISSTVSNADFIKYNLGISYETSTDSSLKLDYPAVADAITIYTIDGFYFFSKEYSESQEFFREFANSQVDFRPGVNWMGEFGFDWVRIGGSNATIDRTFKSNIGHYYDNTVTTKKVDLTQDDSNANAVTFRVEPAEYLRLLRLYPFYPKSGLNAIYSGSWLSLYPSLDSNNNVTQYPKPTLTSGSVKKCLTEAQLELIINISTVITSLKLRFKRVFFQITPNRPNDATVVPGVVGSVYRLSGNSSKNDNFKAPNSKNKYQITTRIFCK